MKTTIKQLGSGLSFVLMVLVIGNFFSCRAQQSKDDPAPNVAKLKVETIGQDSIPNGQRLKDITSVPAGFKIGMTYGRFVTPTIPGRECSEITAPWYPRYNIWSGPSTYDFTSLNNVVNWSHGQGKTTVMHMLAGPNTYMPNWLVTGNFNSVQLDTLMRNMIYALMDANSNKTKIDVFNVVNELFNDDGTYRVDSTMVYNKMGWETDASGITGTDKINAQHPVFIGKAFQYARNKTTAKLELRDYNITIPDHFPRKRKAIYQLLKHMIAKGYPVDAVGEQGHFNIGNKPDSALFVQSVQLFQSLGLQVYLSELDDNVNQYSNPQVWNSTAASNQRKDYNAIVRYAIGAGIKLINIWGVKDTVAVTTHQLLFDKDGNAKPAYYGVQDALLHH